MDRHRDWSKQRGPQPLAAVPVRMRQPCTRPAFASPDHHAFVHCLKTWQPSLYSTHDMIQEVQQRRSTLKPPAKQSGACVGAVRQGLLLGARALRKTAFKEAPLRVRQAHDAPPGGGPHGGDDDDEGRACARKGGEGGPSPTLTCQSRSNRILPTPTAAATVL